MLNVEMVLLGLGFVFSASDLAGGPGQILKRLKRSFLKHDVIPCQLTTNFLIHRTELWPVSTPAQ